MSENIKYVVSVLESNNYGRIVSLLIAIDELPDVEEIYRYIARNRPELFKRLLEIEDTL